MFQQLFRSIVPLDTQLFLLINGLPHFFVTDFILLTVTGIATYGFIWVIFAWVLRKRKRTEDIFLLTFIFIISGILAELFLKNMFGRERPSMVLSSTFLVGPRIAETFSTSSFPSGHAMFAFGLFRLFSFFDKSLFLPLLSFAIIVGFSRIYLGKHYPFDVLGGAMAGFLMAEVLYMIYYSRKGMKHGKNIKNK